MLNSIQTCSKQTQNSVNKETPTQIKVGGLFSFTKLSPPAKVRCFSVEQRSSQKEALKNKMFVEESSEDQIHSWVTDNGSIQVERRVLSKQKSFSSCRDQLFKKRLCVFSGSNYHRIYHCYNLTIRRNICPT